MSRSLFERLWGSGGGQGGVRVAMPGLCRVMQGIALHWPKLNPNLQLKCNYLIPIHQII